MFLRLKSRKNGFSSSLGEKRLKQKAKKVRGSHMYVYSLSYSGKLRNEDMTSSAQESEAILSNLSPSLKKSMYVYMHTHHIYIYRRIDIDGYIDI